MQTKPLINMSKFFFLSFSLSCLLHLPGAVAQTPSDTISLEVLQASIDTFYAAELRTALQQLKVRTRWEWLKFLPALGLTYTLDRRPRPTLSYSSNLLYTSLKNREQQDKKVLDLLHTQETQRLLCHQSLRSKWLQYRHQKEALDLLQVRMATEAQLFQIYEEQYERFERSPTEFLPRKLAWLQQQHELRMQQQRLEALLLDCCITAHFISSGF